MPFDKVNVDVKIPHKSGFSLRHRNSGTITCGTITPLLVEEVIPAARCSCKIDMLHQLPPLASDTYMNVKVKVEAFFVPFRLLSRSFEDFFCDFPKLSAWYTSLSDVTAKLGNVTGRMPVFHFDDDVPSTYWGAGTLLDYLGAMVDSVHTQSGFDFNAASVEAYHLIWQEFYRNPRVQTPAFVPDLGAYTNVAALSPRLCSMPYNYYRDAATITGIGSYPTNSLISFGASTIASAILADGTNIFSLRQRNFGLDFFTAARPTPQQGNASAVTMSIPSGATSTSFTIAQLRAANSLQMFRERNNIPSPRLVDQVRARYGANLADGVAQRPICIGSATYDVVSRGVDATADISAVSTNNPFNTVASQYGRAYGAGSDFLIEDFTANEPGLLFVNQTLVPVVTYSSGVRPYLRRYLSSGSIVEMANPLLQNVGDEPIDCSSLDGDAGNVGGVFGYTDRYGTFMYHPSEVHGLMRDGESLQAFVLQRSFASAPTFGSQFLEIPKTYLDDVFAVSSGVTGLSCWYDSFIDLRISMPLAEYSIPSLQDPAYEHGKSINLRRNGQIF